MGEHDEGMVHSGEQDTPDALRRYRAIRNELAAYDSVVAGRPEIVVLTKADLVGPDVKAALRQWFEAETGQEVHMISSATGEGVPALIRALWTQSRTAIEE